MPKMRAAVVTKPGADFELMEREIPEPARTLFAKNMSSSTCPLVKEDEEPRGCVYAWDWQAFLEGRR